MSHVAVTVQTLVGIEEELDQLMRKLRRDEGNANAGLPVEVHIASIDGGVKRLREERMRVRLATFTGETVPGKSGSSLARDWRKLKTTTSRYLASIRHSYLIRH